jgi:hypothetical protein
MAKGFVPVAPTGTRGRRPSIDDTGIAYKLVLVHGVRRGLQIDTDPAKLRSINKSKYTKYAKYAKYDLVFVGPCTLPALKIRHTRGTACQCLSLYGF